MQFMVKRKNLSVLVFILVGLLACQKELNFDPGPAPPPPPPAPVVREIVPVTSHPVRQLLFSLRPAPLKVTVPCCKDTTIICNNGILRCLSESFIKIKDNSAVTGSIDLYITEAKSMADYIAFGLSTLTSDKFLQTKGMFHILAMKDADTLKLKPGRTISYIMNTPSDPAYEIFKGALANTTENPVTWASWTNARQDSIGFGSQASFIVGLDSLQWTNLDKFWTPANNTDIFVKLPAGYTNTNTMVFLIFRDQKSISGLVPDAANQQWWQGSRYKIPLGINAKLLSVYKSNTEIKYDLSDINTTANLTVNIASLSTVTEAQLRVVLNGL